MTDYLINLVPLLFISEDTCVSNLRMVFYSSPCWCNCSPSIINERQFCVDTLGRYLISLGVELKKHARSRDYWIVKCNSIRFGHDNVFSLYVNFLLLRSEINNNINTLDSDFNLSDNLFDNIIVNTVDRFSSSIILWLWICDSFATHLDGRNPNEILHSYVTSSFSSAGNSIIKSNQGAKLRISEVALLTVVGHRSGGKG